ncbi:MAG: O-methyltransferase [Actinomycetota bacterium]
MANPIEISSELHRYVVANGTPPDQILRRLREQTLELTGRRAGMQIDTAQGGFMTWLTRLIDAELALEIGTFTGYSAICIARGLRDGGRLVCLDVSEEWTAIGRAAWEEAGLADRIELRIGPAAETLAAIPTSTQFDIAFIDADKTGYETYLDLVHPRLRPGGVVMVDNVLQRGRVVDDRAQDESTVAIRAFNDARTTDHRWDTVMLPISDGLTLLQKR